MLYTLFFTVSKVIDEPWIEGLSAPGLGCFTQLPGTRLRVEGSGWRQRVLTFNITSAQNRDPCFRGGGGGGDVGGRVSSGSSISRNTL